MNKISPNEAKCPSARTIRRLTPQDIPALLPPRPERSNKATFGRVVAVCGSRGMSGAAYLAALAAYRVGCGIVEIVTPEENRTILQTLLPEAIVTCYDSDSPNNSAIAAALSRADAAVIGCGLGANATAREVLETALISLRCPAVLDADALNILAAKPTLWNSVPCGTIITPHPGEASRLSGLTVEQILGAPSDAAHSISKSHSVICVLKDHKTIITDGYTAYINGSGNSGMATAGSGDVLAGVIAGLMSAAAAAAAPSPCDTLTVAALGVLLHSLAGDAAAARLTEYSVMASDIIAALPEVLARVTQPAGR